MKNKGRKTKQNHTHTTPSQPSTNNKQIKELKTNQKNLCPRKMDFAASIVVCLVFLGYPLITAGTSLPGLLPGFLGASHGCAEGTAWRLLPSASPTTTASSPVRGHSGEEGWDFGPFSAGSGGCHHIEMIWEYKGGRELWERDLPPTTLVAAAGGGWEGWVYMLVSTAKGGWSWHNGRHRERQDVTQPSALQSSLLRSFPICLTSVLQRARSGGWGLNKYLHLFQVGRKKKGWSERQLTSVHNSGCKAQIYMWKTGYSQM